MSFLLVSKLGASRTLHGTATQKRHDTVAPFPLLIQNSERLYIYICIYTLPENLTYAFALFQKHWKASLSEGSEAPFKSLNSFNGFNIGYSLLEVFINPTLFKFV